MIVKKIIKVLLLIIIVLNNGVIYSNTSNLIPPKSALNSPRFSKNIATMLADTKSMILLFKLEHTRFPQALPEEYDLIEAIICLANVSNRIAKRDQNNISENRSNLREYQRLKNYIKQKIMELKIRKSSLLKLFSFLEYEIRKAENTYFVIPVSKLLLCLHIYFDFLAHDDKSKSYTDYLAYKELLDGYVEQLGLSASFGEYSGINFIEHVLQEEREIPTGMRKFLGISQHM